MAAGPILALSSATAVRPAGGGEEFQRRLAPRFVPNRRPVPAIRRRAAIRVTEAQVVVQPRVRVRALPGQHIPRRLPRFVAPGQFWGGGVQGGGSRGKAGN